MDKHDIVVADPPWRFSSNSKARPGRNPMRHYECMTDDEIAALPVWSWMNKDALLFLWTTAPMLMRSSWVMTAWGFRYVSQIVWVKDHAGTGFWVRNRHEIVLVGRRGRFPCPRPAPFPDSVITGGQREHSRKPEALQDRIDMVWPDASKLEMFARRPRPGWTTWGNEVEKYQMESP
jgi:N6-adenosine-specific RNA methylase IME4